MQSKNTQKRLLSASNGRQQKCHLVFDQTLIKPSQQTINNPFKDTIKSPKFDSIFITIYPRRKTPRLHS